jgi:tRNA modification GTPase
VFPTVSTKPSEPPPVWPEETIVAISTPLGEGGLAVIRLSGPKALSVADAMFRPIGRSSCRPSDAPTHTVQYGQIIRQAQVLDEVLLTVLRAPRTFTREDMVEISCHGGVLPVRMVLDLALEQGAKLALPGEFTKRAFLNGRIDLTQAEAVADLIHARTELALAAANEQLAGKLAQRINQLRDQLLQTLAHLEAHLDFPDEDITPDTLEQMLGRLERAIAMMDELLRTAKEGRLLRRGLRAAIVGRPNVGKSSLLNQLLGQERAIVSPLPGTTRDTIEETANIRGLPVIFIDTAGLRDSADLLEQEGVRRSQKTLAQAELVLHVLDRSEALTAVDQQHLNELAGKPRITVGNKADLPAAWPWPPLQDVPAVEVSCRTGQGIEALKDAVRNQVWAGKIGNEMLEVMINSRHQAALQRARTALTTAGQSLRAGATLELVAVDLRIAVNAVGEIVGKTSTEDLLDSIFSQFCIGK